MANYDSSRTGQAHDNDENRLTTLENSYQHLSDYYLPLSGGTLSGPLQLIPSGGSSQKRSLTIPDITITAIDKSLILTNCDEIRFGKDAWDFDAWAGLRYDSDSRNLYFGIPASPIRHNVDNLTGTLNFPGITQLSALNNKSNFIIGSTAGHPGTSDKKSLRLGLGTVGHTGSPYWCVWVDDTTSNSYLCFTYTMSDPGFKICHTGACTAPSFSNTSSKEIKKDIIPLSENYGTLIDKLKPVSYVYKNDKSNKKRYGLIYEDTIDILPVICNDTELEKTINYIDLIPVLVKEIQDLRARVKELEQVINDG